jgi:hypothetical protein
MNSLQTVVELPEFLRRASTIMNEAERLRIVNYIATNPEAGVSQGGGLRKVKIPREGAAKAADTEPSTYLAALTCPYFWSRCSQKTKKII